MEYKLLYSMDEVNINEFLEIFKESSKENALEWYPESTAEEALEKYENGFLEYMRDTFWKEKGALALLSWKGRYVSSLRLYTKDENTFLMEALETKPDCRKKGFASEIIRRTISCLEEKYDRIELISYTGKHNIASQHTHAAAGMKNIRDYWENEQGERDETQLTFSYKTVRYINGSLEMFPTAE